MSTEDNNNNNGVSNTCANCGREGNDVTNTCNKCKSVMYCNAACKKKHRHKHKQGCDEHVRQAAERAAKLHDEKLFKQPPPQEEDCPICFLLLPSLDSGRRYKACCGKVLCSGCCYAPVFDNQGNEVDNQKCPFCRVPTPKSVEEAVEREKERVEAGDVKAIYGLGCDYYHGGGDVSQDYTKGLELFHRAGELGYAKAYTNIGSSFNIGRGVKVDKKKAIHYFELAAMGGNAIGRHNLGILEENAGNMDRAIKHYIIAAGGGFNQSTNHIKELYGYGQATKENYMKALQSYQTYLSEIKSDQRDKAAVADEEYRYY